MYPPPHVTCMYLMIHPTQQPLYVRVYVYVCMCVYVYVYVYVCMRACVYVCAYACMRVCVRV